jgi:hypothetical protein
MKLPLEIIEKILNYCDWKDVVSCRELQSKFFMDKTKYGDLDSCLIFGSMENFKWLIDKTDDLSDGINFTLFNIACYMRKKDCIEMLIKKKCCFYPHSLKNLDWDMDYKKWIYMMIDCYKCRKIETCPCNVCILEECLMFTKIFLDFC